MRLELERKETGIGKILVIVSALLAVLFAGFGQAGSRTAASPYGGAPLPVLVALESRGPTRPGFERKGDGSPAHADRSRGRGRAVALESQDPPPRRPAAHAVPRFATLPASIGLAASERIVLGQHLERFSSRDETPQTLARQLRAALPSPRDPPASRAS